MEAMEAGARNAGEGMMQRREGRFACAREKDERDERTGKKREEGE
jgi:hypothetical protein